jgi:hypothetical protein
MLRPQDGGYGRASCGSRASNRSNPAMGVIAAFRIALPPCLRFQAGEGRSPHIHSNGILLIAAPGSAISWNSKGKVRGVTFVQRFGFAINLNIHFHSLVMDGIHYEDADKRICFQRLATHLSAPDDDGGNQRF